MVDVADTRAPSRRQWMKPPRLYEEIARDLTEEIVHGRYAPGAFLPTEQELATAYGASRNVVREALKVLIARGLIEMLHGRGSRVLPHQHWQMQDQLIRLMREDPRVPRDLLTLRRILEVEIAHLAAQQATAEQIAEMQETIDRMRTCADQPEECTKHDIRFHQLLAEATGNVLLPLALEPVGQLLLASRLATIHNPGAVERSVSAHIEILSWVTARNADGAGQAMRRHLQQVEDEIRQIKGEAGS